MNKAFLRVVLGFLVLAPYVASADVTGTWTATFETQIGTQNYTYEFAVDGTTLTGTITTANGPAVLESGKVEGSAISFVEKLTYQGMELVFNYTGEIVSDDEIKFTREVAALGIKEELVAKRQ